MRSAAILLAGGDSAVNTVLLASAIVPVFIAIVVCRVAWIWARSDDEGWEPTFAQLLRAAFWLDRGQRGVATRPPASGSLPERGIREQGD